PVTTVGVTTSDEGTDENGEAGASSESSSEGEAESSSSSGGEVEPQSYEHIAIVGITPGLADLGGGVWALNESAMAEIGNAFYADHGDDYEFLVVYTEGELQDIGSFAWAVQYESTGIGLDGYSPGATPAAVGSAGRLLQINMMNAPAVYGDPHDASIAVHELMHHWSAFIELPGTPAPAFLLDDSWAHWNIHTNTGGPSATGYGDLVDLGGGQFQFTVMYPLQVSPLELYLAGWLPPEAVPPMFYVRDASGYEPAQPPFDGPWRQSSYCLDATFSGTRVDFTIADVVAANGARTPAFGTAPDHYRTAFVLVCKDVLACDPAALADTEAQRTAFEVQLPSATGGRATVDTTL
ncbi:MAG TPA: hypothetical protein VG755_01815, partial [Nannocystaceae bacterium]|nr:hypothetical protein [Nannocystaceae bacterium]